MIVPRNRLLIWVALIVLPFAAVAGTIPGTLTLSALAVGGFLAAVVVDAALARGQLAGVRVELPEVVRLQKDRPSLLEVRVHNEALAKRRLRLGFAFPLELGAEFDDRTALLPAETAVSRMEWSLTPNKRGQYRLAQAYLEALSPLGFWAVRKVQPVSAELRVYPNLFTERKNVAALFLRRGNLGARAHRQSGQGRDFEKLREYVPGDSYEEIHWKASAKRGHPVTKVFQVERTQEVYVIVDASRLTAREVAVKDTRETALERFVTAALILGLAAEQQGDQFGLITFGDRILSFVRAKNGEAHYGACRDRLYTLQPQSVTPDFDELCSFIRLRLRKRALLIFLTALDDPLIAESFVKASDLLSRQHLLVVNMLQPPGALPLFSGEAVAQTDDLYSRLGRHLQWNSLRELQKVLKRRGVRFSLLDPEKLAGQVVTQHADIKRRQLF